MTFEEVMAELEAMGTAQNVKIYKRHGASEPMFGVSFANLGKLKKKLKNRHDLGMQLWDSGNMDAQTLGLMIMDGSQFPDERINDEVKKISYYMLTDMFVSEVVMHHKDKLNDRLQRWTKAKSEYLRRAGYSILTNMARSHENIPDRKFLSFIKKIEAEIHDSANRGMQMMNIALLNIGIRNEVLCEAALEASKRIGKVNVDHGDTSCKTYDTTKLLADDTYLEKARKSMRRHK